MYKSEVKKLWISVDESHTLEGAEAVYRNGWYSIRRVLLSSLEQAGFLVHMCRAPAGKTEMELQKFLEGLNKMQ